jgi:BURP domain
LYQNLYFHRLNLIHAFIHFYTLFIYTYFQVKASDLVACHVPEYAYVVFHCHTTTASAYTVSLVGADGTKVQALAACHLNGAAGGPGIWFGYKKLGLKPGSVPICHFFPQDDIIWARV